MCAFCPVLCPLLPTLLILENRLNIVFGDGGDGDGDNGGWHHRARLRPSPATGLVGLKENVYVAEFFRMSGILPFTSER